MSELRRDELMDKITKVKDGDATAFAGPEWNIKISPNDDSSEVTVDLVAHYIVPNEDQAD